MMRFRLVSWHRFAFTHQMIALGRQIVSMTWLHHSALAGFGDWFALLQFEKRMPMLRISIVDNADAATLKLEGKVIGPWARELNRVWSDYKPSLSMKKLCLDLCGVTLVDKSGSRTLRKIFRRPGAEILADTPLARHFAAETMRRMPRKEKKEN